MVAAALACISLSGCAAYRKYQRTDFPDEDMYINVRAGNDTSNIASLSWREMFTDPALMALIETGLEQNTDVNVARARADAAEAALMASRMAYAPSLGIEAQGGASRWNGAVSETYSIGAAASWELDFSGKNTAAKRGAAAAFQGSRDYLQYVRTKIVASVAESYYTLAMLDGQLEINARTLENWRAAVKTQEALKSVGRSNEAGVLQARANVLQLESARLSIQKSISEAENALAAVVGTRSEHISGTCLDNASFPDSLSAGVPLQLLSNRPDVRQSEMALAQAFYAVGTARAAFYPSITLSGTIGWTNNGGGVAVNPGQWLMNAVGSLLQPLFSRGTNVASLKAARARQEEARLMFVQSLRDAGKEVNDAVAGLQTAENQMDVDSARVEVLRAAVDRTESLMRHSGTTYLEVLTARQSLYDAELAYLQDRFDRIRSVIILYRALGGGAE